MSFFCPFSGKKEEPGSAPLGRYSFLIACGFDEWLYLGTYKPCNSLPIWAEYAFSQKIWHEICYYRTKLGIGTYFSLGYYGLFFFPPCLRMGRD
jgi:hypothetical protein